MRRRQNSRGGGRQWVRPVDWDAYQDTALLAPDTAYFQWARVPSDTNDSTSGLFIDPKTLVRTMLRGTLQTFSNTTDLVPTPQSFWIGLIAWTGVPDLAGLPGPAYLPDPTNGALDWIMWLPTKLVGTGTPGNLITNFGHENGWLESRAMRKLPPRMGILACFQYGGGAGALGRTTFNIAVRMALKGDVSASGLGGA